MIEIERQKEKEKFKSDPTELSLDTIDSSLVDFTYFKVIREKLIF